MAEVLLQNAQAAGEESQIELLADYLRTKPYQVNHSVSELAKRFSLDESFVRDVLDTLRGSPNKLTTSESFLVALKSTFGGVASVAKNIFVELGAKPTTSIPVTTVLVLAIVLGMRALAGAGALPIRGQELMDVMNWVMGSSVAALIVIHWIAYLANGMLRYAFFGTGVMFVALAPTALYMNSTAVTVRSFSPVTVFFVAAFLAAVYFMPAAMLSLIGGFLRTARADRKEKRLTRQELLDRLFELQSKLRAFGEGVQGTRHLGALETVRKSLWLPAMAICAGGIVGGLGIIARASFMVPGEVPDFIMVALAFFKVIAYVSIGYVAGGVRKALFLLVLVFGGSLAIELLPVSFFGPSYIASLAENGSLLAGLGVVALCALVGGVGAHIDTRARVRRKLMDSDPAVMLAEVVEIQWRLNPTEGATCVVAVDVAASTRMKAASDPLSIEYSFRAYQELLSSLSSRRSGTRLSTAGDGAIFSFESCAEALYFAKEVHTELEKFNQRVNRLGSPFRVRIGVHTGRTSAQLTDVPFNELIDIAAHLERSAPVGGIALSEPVATSLADERVTGLREQVDGLNVFLVLDPKLTS